MRTDKTHQCNVDLVNKMMEKHKLTYYDILGSVDENKKWYIDGEPWFDHFTLTQEEKNAFSEWAINHIAKTLRISKRDAKEEFQWWDLAYGLKVKEKEDETDA